MKFAITIIAVLFAWSVNAAGIDDLKHKASLRDPQAQYDLALHYQNGIDVEPSAEQAQYWFELAAENGNNAAQTELIKLLLKSPTQEDIEQALYWLTQQAVNGDISVRAKIAKISEQYADQLAPDSLALIWYRVAGQTSTQAEEKYAQLLENRFNQRRLKQVSQLEQLDSAFEQSRTDALIAEPTAEPSSGSISSDHVTISLIIITAIGTLLFLAHTKRRRNRTNQQQQETLAELNKKLRNQNRSEQRLRAQLTTLIKQYKKLQAQTQPQPQNNVSDTRSKITTACTLFACEMSSIPDETVLKQRYRQLSKVYHPDAGGNSAAMTQLNQAFKLLTAARKAQNK